MGEIFYFRAHGRNAKLWWNPKESWERYDYCYGATVPINTQSTRVANLDDPKTSWRHSGNIGPAEKKKVKPVLNFPFYSHNLEMPPA